MCDSTRAEPRALRWQITRQFPFQNGRTIRRHVLCAPQLLYESPHPVAVAWLCHASPPLVVHLLHVVSVQQLHQQGVVVFLQVFRSKENIQSCLAMVQRSVRTDEAWLSSGQVLYHFDKHTIRELHLE
jgi:hypothetical protein